MNESSLINVFNTASFVDSIVSILAASIVIYLFIYKRKSISSIYYVLLNYTFQTTLRELNTKIDRLNDFNVDDKNHRNTVIIILNEVVGQMRGNPIWAKKCNPILTKLTKYAEKPDNLTEARKRSLVSELRETLRNISIHNYKEMIGEDYE